MLHVRSHGGRRAPTVQGLLLLLVIVALLLLRRLACSACMAHSSAPVMAQQGMSSVAGQCICTLLLACSACMAHRFHSCDGTAGHVVCSWAVLLHIIVAGAASAVRAVVFAFVRKLFG